jgi:beta-barrel assembly-enhancing protease
MALANQFPGGAFQGVEDEVTVTTIGTISVSSYVILFEGEALTMSLPTQNLRVDLDESAEKVLLTHPNFPGWTIYSLDVEIVEHPSLQRFGLKKRLAELQEETAGPSKHAKRVYTVLAVIVGLFVCLWAFSNQITSMIVESLPKEWETKIGQAAFEELKEDFEFSKDPILTNRVYLVAQRLKRGLPYDAPKFSFYVADTPVVNALALPGGTVVVMRGLIEDSDANELAGVIAHEMAHVTQKHSMRAIAQRMGPIFIAKYVFGGEGALAAMTAGAAYIGGLQYSRENERAADNEAWEILVRANVDPRSLAQYFRKMSRTERRGVKIPDMFSTHPPTTERISYLEERWRSSAKTSGFEPVQGGSQPERGGSNF